MMKKFVSLTCLLFTMQFIYGQSVKIVSQDQPCSIRGLSVLNNKIAWLSGSKGHFAKTADGGKTWNWQQVKGFEQSDFRDIEVFSASEAILMSSGTPALLLRTTDGGTNWQVVYRNDDPAYFLDGMAFINSQYGYILGDPIDGKFLLLETRNGGKSWTIMPDRPAALPGEAAFAASGTCMQARKNNITFVSGGTNSRLLSTDIKHLKWSGKVLPITQGKPSTGAFSVVTAKHHTLIVGGDYAKNKLTDSIACYLDAENKIINMQQPPAGYQSCVTNLQGSIFLATGTSGTNISTDDGKNWKQMDTTSFNVCQKAKHGKLTILAGDHGKVALFKNH